MPSMSVQILEHLKTMPEGSIFDTDSLAAMIPSVTRGAVSGFVSRLHKEGAIAVHDVGQRATGRLVRRYQMVDLGKVSARDARSRGGIPGRMSSGGTKSTRDALIDTLFTVIEKLEGMHVSIEDYTTEELLREIGRRTKAAQGGGNV